MANEIETALKNAATSVAQYVKNASVLQVETRYVEVGDSSAVNYEHTLPVARSIIKLDGDSETVIPLQRTAAGSLEVDNGLFNLHQQNVAAAIDYRVRMLNALLATINRTISGG